MNFKLKALAAALAIAATAPAGAAIVDAASGNGELFLSVWDTTNQVSYTRDLGILMSNFTDTNLSYSADGNWTTFLGMVSNPSTLQWNIMAGDSVGVAAFARNYLTTSTLPATSLAVTTNSQFANFGQMDGYVDAVNSLDGTSNDGTANVSSIHTSADGFAYVGAGFNNNDFGKAPFTNDALLGQSMNFYALTNPDTNVTHKIQVTQFGNTSGPSLWTLSTDGSLAYNVSAVPVPAAMWLFGSGLIGLVGVARRKGDKA